MADWGRRVATGSLLGAVVGVLLGLLLGRLLWPPAGVPTVAPTLSAEPAAPTQEVRPSSTAPAAPDQAPGQSDAALVLVSAVYAVDGDLERARERLAALELEDAPAAVAALALRHAADGNRHLATDLATLAAALGYPEPGLLAYVATATPSPTATRSPTATSTPRPTATPALPPPSPTTPPLPAATRRPAATAAASATPPPAAPTSLPWDWWDRRVDILEPPVRLVAAQVAPGERYWRLVRLEWWKPGEGGNALIYVTTLNEKGNPAWGQEVIVGHGAEERLYTSPKPGEPYGANYPMYSTLNSYQVFVGGSLPSDRVTGLGLGDRLGGTDHTTFVLIFQLTTK